MISIINYFIEANFGLIFFAVVYWLFLRKENQFSLNRGYLLAGIFFALLFPLWHFSTPTSFKTIPSIRQIIPTYWLPEVNIQSQQPTNPGRENFYDIWLAIKWIYGIVALVLTVVFLNQLFRIVLLLVKVEKYHWNACWVAESGELKPTFSFFNFIFIGQADQLTLDEKKEILTHELVHVRGLHSFDVILLNIVGIVFWFNPIVRIYKKMLMQLHEFEADARSVETQDADSYCLLLAKVALESEGLSLVNHFNHSLTLKRIVMMTTLKKKIQNWKAFALLTSIVMCFVIVSCQDQGISDLKEVNKNSAAAGFIPSEVKVKLDELQKNNPSKEYVVIQLNDEGKKTLEKFGGYEEGKNNLEKLSSNYAFATAVTTQKNSDGAGLTYVIIQKGQQTSDVANFSVSEDNIYTLVEESPAYVGGFDSLKSYLVREIRYPESAKNSKTEGRVFVSFVITKEGQVTIPQIVKGVDPDLDKEALRVVAGLPKWIPGKQSGQNVNVRFVMPISFRLSN